MTSQVTGSFYDTLNNTAYTICSQPAVLVIPNHKCNVQTQSCLDVSTSFVIYFTRLLIHTIPNASDDKYIFFKRLCANINSDGCFGNCLTLNDNAIASPLDDNRNSSRLRGL